MTAASREYIARYKKSERLAGQLIKWAKEHGKPCTDEVAAKVCLALVPSFSPEHWKQIADAATITYAADLEADGLKAVHPPHSQETVDEIMDRLRAMTTDPFALFEVAS